MILESCGYDFSNVPKKKASIILSSIPIRTARKRNYLEEKVRFSNGLM